jgi:hypothetical protein
MAERDLPPPTVRLLIADTESGPVLTASFDGGDFEPGDGGIPLPPWDEAERLSQTIFDDLQEQPEDTDPDRYQAIVDEHGRQLWRFLIGDGTRRSPQLGVSLSDLFWERLHGQEGLSITVISSRPYVPWELVKPFGGPDELESERLGVIFAMAWWPSPDLPGTLALNNDGQNRTAVFIPRIPDSHPDGCRPLVAQNRCDTSVENFLGAERFGASSAARLVALRLDDVARLIYVYSHGSPSTVCLSDEMLSADDFFARTEPGFLQPACAVYVACKSAGAGPGTQWRVVLPALNCRAFVGTDWQVFGKPGREAALLLFQKLFQDNATLGQAIQALHATKKNSYEAFSAVGHSSSQISYNVPLATGAFVACPPGPPP